MFFLTARKATSALGQSAALPNRSGQRIQIVAVRFALTVEQRCHVLPCFFPRDALVEFPVEAPVDETVVDFGGRNLAPHMRVSRCVRVDILEPFIDANNRGSFVQSVEKPFPAFVFGVIAPGVEREPEVFCEPQWLALRDASDGRASGNVNYDPIIVFGNLLIQLLADPPLAKEKVDAAKDRR